MKQRREGGGVGQEDKKGRKEKLPQRSLEEQLKALVAEKGLEGIQKEVGEAATGAITAIEKATHEARPLDAELEERAQESARAAEDEVRRARADVEDRLRLMGEENFRSGAELVLHRESSGAPPRARNVIEPELEDGASSGSRVYHKPTQFTDVEFEATSTALELVTEAERTTADQETQKAAYEERITDLRQRLKTAAEEKQSFIEQYVLKGKGKKKKKLNEKEIDGKLDELMGDLRDRYDALEKQEREIQAELEAELASPGKWRADKEAAAQKIAQEARLQQEKVSRGVQDVGRLNVTEDEDVTEKYQRATAAQAELQRKVDAQISDQESARVLWQAINDSKAQEDERTIQSQKENQTRVDAIEKQWLKEKKQKNDQQVIADTEQGLTQAQLRARRRVEVEALQHKELLRQASLVSIDAPQDAAEATGMEKDIERLRKEGREADSKHGGKKTERQRKERVILSQEIKVRELQVEGFQIRQAIEEDEIALGIANEEFEELAAKLPLNGRKLGELSEKERERAFTVLTAIERRKLFQLRDEREEFRRRIERNQQRLLKLAAALVDADQLLVQSKEDLEKVETEERGAIEAEKKRQSFREARKEQERLGELEKGWGKIIETREKEDAAREEKRKALGDAEGAAQFYIDRPSRLEMHTHKLMEHRQKMAEAVRLLEEELLRLSPEEIEVQALDLIKRKLEEADIDPHVAPRIAEKVLASVERVVKAKKEAIRFQEKLDATFGSRLSPVDLGRELLLFQVKPKSYPQKGSVAAVIENGYLKVSCENREDFKAFKWGTGNPNSIGTFFSYIEWNLGGEKFKIPAIVILGVPGTAEHERTFTHEYQHFVNDQAAELFSSLEPKSASKDQKETKDMRELKDEVLAFIRHGASTAEMSKDFKEGYAHLFNAFPDDRRTQVHQLVAKIIEALERVDLWNQGPKGRALLVNQLFDVSLERFPAYLYSLKNHLSGQLSEEAMSEELRRSGLLHPDEERVNGKALEALEGQLKSLPPLHKRSERQKKEAVVLANEIAVMKNQLKYRDGKLKLTEAEGKLAAAQKEVFNMSRIPLEQQDEPRRRSLEKEVTALQKEIDLLRESQAAVLTSLVAIDRLLTQSRNDLKVFDELEAARREEELNKEQRQRREKKAADEAAAIKRTMQGLAREEAEKRADQSSWLGRAASRVGTAGGFVGAAGAGGVWAGASLLGGILRWSNWKKWGKSLADTFLGRSSDKKPKSEN